MTWVAIKAFLTDNGVWLGSLAALVAIIGFAWAWVWNVLKATWRFVSGSSTENNEKSTADVIVDRLLQEQQLRLEAEQERDGLKQAVEDLQAQSGPEEEKALAALEQGETAEAEELFREIAETNARAGTDAHKKAARAYRNLGALAFLHDTQKALEA